MALGAIKQDARAFRQPVLHEGEGNKRFAQSYAVADHHARFALQNAERLAVRMLLMRVEKRQDFKRL